MSNSTAQISRPVSLVTIVFVLAFVQFVVLVINGHTNDELKRFSLNLLQYLFELLAFVTFARDNLPFPIGPFPRAGS